MLTERVVNSNEQPLELIAAWQAQGVPLHETYLLSCHDPQHPHVPFSQVGFRSAVCFRGAHVFDSALSRFPVKKKAI